ncbi:hypothetical protein EII29_08315 [Leptotrichia sp. OH3620_COT-345]|uniref:hypothetical protein n=1 Tax=Leptotrichia sp. OH3620_COT-345 TaxID=2491048 RepID=UPI000F650E38|nr:hypothetical protein [Leptotrichia sp. OH3620_COT-345]RRD39110.1 hypothetical protein EII29_08315 [Leptotrichia sp. OH3620_COT-345]
MDKFRYIEIKLILDNNELVYNNDNFNIDFSLETDRSSQSNVLELNLYNIKERENGIDSLEYEFMKLKPRIELYAGYREKKEIKVKDLVFSGQLATIKNDYADLDIKYSLVCFQERDILVMQTLNVSYPKGNKPSFIIKDLVEKVGSKEEVKLGIGKIEPFKDLPYQSNFSKSNTSLQKIFEALAKDTMSIFYIENGLLYFLPKHSFVKEKIKLKQMDLLDLKADDNGYNVKLGFRNFKINTQVYIEGLEKDFVIDKIKHNCNGEDGDFVTELKILDMDIFGQNMLKELEEIKKKSEEKVKEPEEKENNK